MPATEVQIVSPRVAQVDDELQKAIRSLDDEQAKELLFDLDKWALTVDDGRDTIGLLNARYEVCVFEGHSPIEWIVGAYDTSTREFVLAELLRSPKRPSLDEAARLCARALGEPVNSVR